MLTVLSLLPFRTVAAANASNESAQLLLNKFNGTIRDFDANRIIWVTNDNKTLWLYNRMDGSQIGIYDATGTDDVIREAKLSAQGVVYNLNTATGSDIWPPVRTVSVWKDGQAEQIAVDEDLYEMSGDGNVAVLTKHTVDLTTGQSREPGYDKADVSADGAVIYTAISAPANTYALYQSLPDGTVTQLATPSAQVPQWNGWTLGFYGPLTDGTNIVYRELVTVDNYRYMNWILRLRSADGTVSTLARNPWAKGNYYVPNDDYRINNGWVAYAEYHKEQDSWSVNVRSPEGAVQQLFEGPAGWSFYSTPLSVDELGPDGTVAYTYHDQSYLYSMKADKVVSIAKSPSRYQYREHVFTGPAGTEFRFVAWYRVDGGSLYSVRV